MIGSDSPCIPRVYSIGLSIMKAYINRVPFALPYYKVEEISEVPQYSKQSLSCFLFFLSFHLKPR